MVSAAMRLKDACSLEGKLWQRHCFANIGPYSQRYGFSSNHVWILELDHNKMLNTEELMLSNCGAGEDSRVPWTARRSKQSNLKKISPEHSLEGLMLKLKLQSLATWCKEPTHWKRSWCWKDWGKKRREQQRMRLLDGISDSMDMNLSQSRETVKEREAWYAVAHGAAKNQTRLSDWTTTYYEYTILRKLFPFQSLWKVSKWRDIYVM